MPAVAFITWPTNQPMACGFSFTWAAWPGLSAISLATMGSIVEPSVTCFRPRSSTIRSGSWPFSTMIAKHPERVIEKAVYGMLPKTALGRQVLRGKLRVAHSAGYVLTGFPIAVPAFVLMVAGLPLEVKLAAAASPDIK